MMKAQSMQQLKSISLFLLAAIGIVGLFWISAAIMSLHSLNIIVNGLFIGGIISVIIAFGPLAFNTVIGKHPYDRVRQMTIGFALMWIAFASGAFVPIMTGQDVGATRLFARYLAFVAACFQVTAPDFGLGIFYGRDRKFLWTFSTIGLMAAIYIATVQTCDAC